MPADRAIGATAAVSADVSGPSITLSPLLIAVLAATAAPAAVPPVSMTSRAGAPSFGSASSAACARTWPISARGPVIGSRIATFCPDAAWPGPPRPSGRVALPPD